MHRFQKVLFIDWSATFRSPNALNYRYLNPLAGHAPGPGTSELLYPAASNAAVLHRHFLASQALLPTITASDDPPRLPVAVYFGPSPSLGLWL